MNRISTLEATPGERVSRREALSITAITMAFTSLVALWALLAPVFDAPDEPLHLNSAIRLTDGWDWPAPGDARVTQAVLAAMAEASAPAGDRSTFEELAVEHPGYGGIDQMTQHPPFYYLYAAGILNLIDYADVRADIAVIAVRLGGLLFAAPLPILAWASVRRLTQSPRAAIIGGAAVLAVPQLAHIMGSVSNDVPTITFSAVVIWVGIRLMTGDRSWFATIGLGVALGLAAFTKGTALPLVAFAVLVVAVWPRSLSVPTRLVRLIVMLACAGLGGWWWVKNIFVYGKIQPPSNLYADNPFPEGSGPSVLYYGDQLWRRVTRSYWGNFGWLDHPMPAIVTDTLSVVAIAVVLGFAFRRNSSLLRTLVLASVPLLYLMALLYQTWPTYVRTQLPAGLQGRYFFPALIALIALSAIAWQRMVRPESRPAVGVGLLLSFAGIAALGLAIEYNAVYSSPSDWALRSPAGGPLTAVTIGVVALLAAGALSLAIRFIVARRPAIHRTVLSETET